MCATHFTGRSRTRFEAPRLIPPAQPRQAGCQSCGHCASQADANALENAIHIATENCNWLDANGPFVFEIKGTAITVKAHIITGECAYAVADADPLSLEIVSPTQVSVVGIYAQGQAGVLTHHGTSVHMHVIFQRDGATITGHIDEISFLAGAELHLPTE